MKHTVKLFGKQVNTWWLIGGGAGVVVAVWWYRRASSGSSASSSSSVDPVTGLPYSQDNQVDPLTGMTYLQEAQTYGSVSAAEQQVSAGAGLLGSGETAGSPTGYDPLAGISSSAGSGAGQSFSTNAQWSQAVTAGLADLGYSTTDISAALGLFFQGQPLGSGADGVSYASIVQAAEAEFGPPPVGSFTIIVAPSSGGGGGTTGSGGGTGSTGGGGSPAPVKKPASAPGGLSTGSLTATGATVSWHTVANATGYEVVAWEATAAHPVIFAGEIAGTSHTFRGLKHNEKYGWYVAAKNSAGAGPHSANQHFTTKK